MNHNHVDSPGISDFNDDSGFLSDQGNFFTGHGTLKKEF